MSNPYYFRLAAGKVGRTAEIIPGVLMVDYDDAGNALGIEVLAEPEGKLPSLLPLKEAEWPERKRLFPASMLEPTQEMLDDVLAGAGLDIVGEDFRRSFGL